MSNVYIVFANLLWRNNQHSSVSLQFTDYSLWLPFKHAQIATFCESHLLFINLPPRSCFISKLVEERPVIAAFGCSLPTDFLMPTLSDFHALHGIIGNCQPCCQIFLQCPGQIELTEPGIGYGVLPHTAPQTATAS